MPLLIKKILFQDSLHALMATLSVSNPFFIRCIKPNMEKVSPLFRISTVLAVYPVSFHVHVITIDTLLVESECFRPGGGPQPAEVFWDAGDSEDPSRRLPRAQNLQRFLPPVCIFNKFTLRCDRLD